MLLFNGNDLPNLVQSAVGFHTSHVTVQPLTISLLLFKNLCFHTSHVTVQQYRKVDCTVEDEGFPYIPCYCSTKYGLISTVLFANSFHTSHVTVQHSPVLYNIGGE